MDDLPFQGMPADDVGALQEHPRRCGKYTVAHVAKSTRNARGHYISTLDATSLHGPVGAHDEVGLFITEENDTPQMIEKYMIKHGFWKKGDNMAKQLIDWNQDRPDIFEWRVQNTRLSRYAHHQAGRMWPTSTTT